MPCFRILCLWMMLAWVAAVSAADRPPNLLILHTDEHHTNTLGCYGGKIVKTPHIDSLATGGVICTSFYATTPVCSPSRAALVSGRYPQNTPVVNNNIRLDDKIVTFAEVLRRAGYATGYAGKWHLDGSGKPQWGPKRKFGFEDNRFMFNRGHWKKFVDGPKGPDIGAKKNGKPGYGLDGADDKTFSTDWLSNKTIEFIRANKDKPFCYMVSYPDPHGPNTVRAPYDKMYENVEVPIPKSLQKALANFPKWAPKGKGITPGHLRKIMPAYYGMVKCIDDNVGRIIKALKDEGVFEDTLIVFTSDHGDLCGEHCRLNKGVPYEGSARIPFIVHYPKKIKGGRVVPEALSCVDFFPTVMGLMARKHDVPVEGRDASMLLAAATPEAWEDVAFLRGTKSAPWHCAVTDRYKLVYSGDGAPWFVDLAKDPDELINVFGKPEYRPIIRQLTAKLIAYGRKYDDRRLEEPQIKAVMQRVVQ
jgi:arylsulfatase A-like enzyme